MPIPIVLIHGYSDKGASFKPWRDLLIKHRGYAPGDVHICSYRTLTNEVTIKDIAEGFDRALKINAGIKPGEPFDAVVHSTGMLVLRSWLSVYGRHARVKHIIALAPASFGSPLAHKGRSWIGSVFKGSRHLGPDFMEAGDLVLDGLELGSRFTWDLAHTDLLHKDKIFYGPTSETPYVFTFCGNKQYGGLRGMVTSAPGTDGTVRWAGCALNSRKIILDFTKPPGGQRYQIAKWKADERTNLLMPFIPVAGLNHATIIEAPTPELVTLVMKALQVDSLSEYDVWIGEATEASRKTLEAMEPWQQFAVRARDERGDPITDYNLQLYKLAKGGNAADDDAWEPVKLDVHAYSTDNSYRSFHVSLRDLLQNGLDNLQVEFIASSGSELLGYLEHLDDDAELPQESHPTFTMDITDLLQDAGVQFFYPFTTTLIEIIINREPKPFRSINDIAWFEKE